MGDRAAADSLMDKAETVMKTDLSQATHAYHMFDNACLTDPTYWRSYYRQANNNSDLKKAHAAIAGYRVALSNGPPGIERANVLSNLSWQLMQVGHIQEAVDCAQLAVEINPELVHAWINLSCAYGILRKTRSSVAAAERAKALKGDDPIVQMAATFAYFFDRQWSKAYAEFECRYAYKLHHFLHYPYPAWRGEPDKCLLLAFDQGLGDTISYARFLPMAAARCRHVYVCIQPELQRWFTTAFLHIPNITIVPGPINFPGDAEYWSTYMSLPYALGLDNDTIETTPHVKPPASTVLLAGVPWTSVAWKVPDRKLHVGVSWAGSTANEINHHRSFPVQHLLELYRVEGIQLYSFQVDERKNDLYEIGAAALIKDMSPYIRDVSDTLGLLRHFDLVITCESALGHIAACAGIKTWVPYSFLGRDHRLGTDGSNPLWYKDTHRTFNQGSDRNWEPVFAEIAKALRKRVPK
jgi:tetratricopeptide (TPR) repeat protein